MKITLEGGRVDILGSTIDYPNPSESSPNYLYSNSSAHKVQECV